MNSDEKPSEKPGASPDVQDVVIEVKDFSFSYDLGKSHSLSNISLEIPRNRVTAIIGPSGCGKSTLLRSVNRMNDTIPTALITGGKITVLGSNVHDPKVDPILLRKAVGMVLQKSNPFPKSIYENVAFGLRIAGERKRAVLDQGVEESLKGAALWDEVKDHLNESALGLSGGQQQRLCIARAIAVKPKILLMDEPCSALDPSGTEVIEELIANLRDSFTVVMVTHNMQQATRVSDLTAFFYLGKLIEFDLTTKLFTNPAAQQTEDYISGRFG